MKMKVRARSYAAGEPCESRDTDPGGILARHSAERWIRRERVTAREGQTSCRHHTVDPETKGIEKTRSESVHVVQGEELAPRIITCPLVIQLVGLPNGPDIEHVSAVESVLFRKVVVNSGGEIVLWGDLLARKSENPRIARRQKGTVGQGIESIHERQDIGVDCDLPGREVARSRSRRGHGINLGQPQRLP